MNKDDHEIHKHYANSLLLVALSDVLKEFYSQSFMTKENILSDYLTHNNGNNVSIHCSGNIIAYRGEKKTWTLWIQIRSLCTKEFIQLTNNNCVKFIFEDVQFPLSKTTKKSPKYELIL